MKIVRFCLLLTMMFSIAPAQGQDTKSIPWYGRLAVGFGHDDVRNVDIGLLSVIPSLEGFQLGLIAGGTHKSMSGVGIYGIMGASEEADGVQIAGINICETTYAWTRYRWPLFCWRRPAWCADWWGQYSVFRDEGRSSGLF